MGLSAALATAGRSLEVFSAGIQVANQNISNAGDPNYIRESVVTTPNLPYAQGRLIFGTGVLASGIRQQIDKFLETRNHAARSDASGATARSAIYTQLESALNELGDKDLSTSLSDFLGKLNEVVNQPEIQANRDIAVREGQALADNITQLRGRIDLLRQSQAVKVTDLVTEANGLVDTIAQLNKQIINVESAGKLKSDAGALRSQRYAALNRLAEIVPIRTVEQSNGSINVFLGSDYLVLYNQVQKFETETTVDRNVPITTVKVEGANTPISGSGGELAGVLFGRDEILGGFVDQLDQLTGGLIHEFNKVYSQGEGLTGFTDVTSTYRVTDPTAALTAAGLAFTPTHGNLQVKVVNKDTGLATTSTLAIDLDGIGADTSLNDLQAAFDGLANVNASITTDGRLRLTTADGYELRFAGDSSGVLASLGINTFFTGDDASTIGVNQAVVDDPTLFAAGRGGGPADGTNALQLAQFLDSPVAALGGQSLGDAYDRIISQTAQGAAGESALSDGYTAFLQTLLNQRSQFSGVSLDEEALNILQLQRSFQAAARVISTVDELFNILLNI